jgi:hypothetical protein
MAAAAEPAALRKQVERLLARQRALVRELLALRDQMQGSVFARYGTCGKRGCACREGRGHGPYFVLSTRGRAGGAFVYLTRGQAQQARHLVAAGRSYRQGLARLKALNDELLALMKRYQRAQAKAGGRRLGVAAA